MQSVIIMADGLLKKVDPANGKDFSLEELNEIVDGYIEILHIGDKLLVCNEEGKLQNLQYNATATRLINAAGIKDYIVGNALFCDKDKIK
nr:MAG TPA: protein of unknown function DUF3846 [Caudoviricetes sp.]